MHTFTATAHVQRYIRANVAGRIGNQVSPAESAFLGPNAMMMNDLQTRGRRAFPGSAR